MADAFDCRAQDVLVIRELLQKPYLAARRGDGNQIVLAHLFVNEIRKRFACAAQAIKRQVPVVEKKDNRAPAK